MPGTCVVGLQWGDEAKGKLVDLLTPQFDIVVRYAGGANAGHTVVAGGKTYKLHQVPSGILNDDTMNVITPGVVLNLPTLLGELRMLADEGIHVGDNFMLSERMHLVFPWHIAEDKAHSETKVDGEAIGTTLRGIGPCYRDKVGRTHGIRLGDLYRADFEAKVASVVEAKLKYLAAIGSKEQLDPAAIHAEYAGYAEQIKPYVGDTTGLLLDAAEEGKRLLFEGAQGALLDIDHGTYPFVTSSNSSGVGISSGSGVPGRWIDKVIGVVKAYCTRVGGGPFVTEEHGEMGDTIRDRGNEYGTTTGRPRRCGWFDAVAARYTARLSGVESVAVTMLDVLSTLPEVQVCTAYELHGERLTSFPCHADDLRQVKPVYETLPGWDEEITGVRQFDDLPANAQAYVQRLEELLDRRVEIVSVGPDREQTIKVDANLVAAT